LTISEALATGASFLSWLPSPLLDIMCGLMSLLTFTGIAANKIISITEIFIIEIMLLQGDCWRGNVLYK
jgi:hypothetical protein